MRRNGKKWMALLGLVFAAAAAAVSYGAQSGPGMDLVTAADGRTVREEDRDVLADPEITGDTDKILGLNLGADDYIAKPFNALEVVARVKAQLRRSQRVPPSCISINGLTLNTETCVVTKNDEPVLLTPTEYKMLSLLMRSPGRIFTKVQLSEAVNGVYFESDENTIMVHISKLREKIEDNPRKPARLVTIRGLGYRFEKK